jgi:hypothetical protein
MKAQWLAILMMTVSVSSMAQPTVYESKEQDGATVFSDQPSPDARTINLPPSSVIQSDLPPLQTQSISDADTTSTYNSITIAFPKDQGGVHTNTGAFDASVQIEPELRTNMGDRIHVKLDGTLLPESYSSNNIGITETDWQNAANANPDNGSHTLQARIINKEGKSLIESAPVTFWAHRATVR